MSAPSPPFKTIFKLILWNGLQSRRHITPDVISVIKMPSIVPLSSGTEKVIAARSGEQGGCSSTVIY
jgi:hypothetical protein